MKETFNSEGKHHSFNNEPAIIMANGTKFWYKDGEMHRDNDEPSFIDGTTKMWHKDGILYRDNDLPAFISSAWTLWYKNGVIHRDNNKPAAINSKEKRWYINGKELNKKQIAFLKKINASEIKHLPWLINEDELLNSVIEKRMSEGS
jgi:hypothetical protein